MRRLSARSDIFVQSSLGFALALNALLVLWWVAAYCGGFCPGKEEGNSRGRCMMSREVRSTQPEGQYDYRCHRDLSKKQEAFRGALDRKVCKIQICLTEQFVRIPGKPGRQFNINCAEAWYECPYLP